MSGLSDGTATIMIQTACVRGFNVETYKDRQAAIAQLIRSTVVQSKDRIDTAISELEAQIAQVFDEIRKDFEE